MGMERHLSQHTKVTHKGHTKVRLKVPLEDARGVLLGTDGLLIVVRVDHAANISDISQIKFSCVKKRQLIQRSTKRGTHTGCHSVQ